MFKALGRFSVRFRWPIIIIWVALIPILVSTLPNISDVSQNNNSDFLPKNTPSLVAINLESAFRGKHAGADLDVIIVSSSANPVTDSAVSTLSQKLQKQPDVQQVQDAGSSKNGNAHLLVAILSDKVTGPGAVQQIADLGNHLKTAAPSGVQVYLAGQLADEVASNQQQTHGKDNTQLYTVIFIIVLLLIVFRALLAPFITLLPAGVALAISQPLIAELTKANIGVKVSFITEILLVVLILGAGTDYGLFLVFRVREELRKGLAPKEAVVAALTRVGESISFSALTVVAALLCLLFAKFGIYHGLGPALTIGLVVMLLAALTLLPALLAVLGRAVFWPSRTRKTPLKIGLWGKVADSVIKRPWAMIALGVIIFAGLTSGIIGYKATGFSSGSAPAGSDAAKGDALLSQYFPSTGNSPQLAVFQTKQNVWNDPSIIQEVQQQLQASKLFTTIYGPLQSGITPAQLSALHAAQPNSSLLKPLGQFISADGHTFQLFVHSDSGKPGSAAAANATPRLRTAVSQAGQAIHAEQSGLFSNDAIVYDINHVSTQDLKHILPIVLVIIALLLALLLRSLVAPWYLILTVGLSYLASIGFAMLVFVHWGGQDGLNFVVPFMLFLFSMALGEDYNILVMSRVREEAHHEPNLKAAVTKAVGITGTTVTSAGLILAGTFGVLGLSGGGSQLQQIGYSIAFGILLDTFFVRTLLVPSIVSLLGRYNWWPSQLSQKE